MSKKPSNGLTIRNSTVEFLIFTAQAGENGIEVRHENETIWLTQKLMAELFDADRSVITKHLKNIFTDNELVEASVCADFAHTASDGKTYQTRFSCQAILDNWLGRPRSGNRQAKLDSSIPPCLRAKPTIQANLRIRTGDER